MIIRRFFRDPSGRSPVRMSRSCWRSSSSRRSCEWLIYECIARQSIIHVFYKSVNANIPTVSYLFICCLDPGFWYLEISGHFHHIEHHKFSKSIRVSRTLQGPQKSKVLRLLPTKLQCLVMFKLLMITGGQRQRIILVMMMMMMRSRRRRMRRRMMMVRMVMMMMMMMTMIQTQSHGVQHAHTQFSLQCL